MAHVKSLPLLAEVIWEMSGQTLFYGAVHIMTLGRLALLPLICLCFGSTSSFAGTIFGFVGGRIDDGNFMPSAEIIASDTIFAGFQIGLLEFNLATLSPIPNTDIVVELDDSGGLVVGLSSTRVFVYSGDGAITPDDLTISSISSFDITRPHIGGPTQHDVTAAVNAILAGGGTHAGFRFEPITGGDGGQDSFGFAASNKLLFSDIPEPGTASLLLIGLGLGVKRPRRSRRPTHPSCR